MAKKSVVNLQLMTMTRAMMVRRGGVKNNSRWRKKNVSNDDGDERIR